MDEHPSDLRLDELAAGLPVDAGTRAHVASCPRCSERLRELSSHRASSPAAPEPARVRRSVLARAAKSPTARLWVLAATSALALALVVALEPVLRAPDTRVKGWAWVQLVASDGAPVAEARPGERLQLVAFGAGKSFAAALAVDESGAVDVLWPGEGDRAAAIPIQGKAALTSIEVTPGSVAVVAFFGDEPFSISAARDALERGAAEARARGASPVELEPPRGVAPASARVLLKVRP